MAKKKKITRKGRARKTRSPTRVVRSVVKRVQRKAVTRARPPKKKGAKRAHSVRKTSRTARSRVSTHRRALPKKVTRTARLVRKSAYPISRPAINADRNERAALKHALGVIRKHVRGFEPGDGYAVNDVIRFSKTRQRAILKKSQTIKELLASPHDLLKPRNEKEKRALRPFARKQLRGAKHYIVHKPSDSDTVTFKKGRVSFTRRQGRVEFTSIYFMFHHAPQGEDDAVEMLEEMLPEMPVGFYIMQTGAHGDTGEPVHRDRLIEQLRNYILAYEPQQAEVVWTEVEDEEGKKTMHEGFTQAVLGYRFAGSKLDGVIIQQNKIDARRQAQREFNERLRKQSLTPAEKFAAQEKRRAQLAKRKRKTAAQKAVVTRRKAAKKRSKAKVAVRTVAPKKFRSQKKASRKK